MTDPMASTAKLTEPLTPEDRANWDRDGYLVLDSVVSASRIESISAEMDDLYRDLPEGEQQMVDGVMYSWNRVMDAWRINENVRALAVSPIVLSALEELYGRKPLPFQTLNFRVGTQQPAHSDTVHFNSDPPGFMGGVWVALEDIDMDNGPLMYYPGSHKLPEVTMQDVGVEADPSHYGDYERFIGRLIEEKGLEPDYATIKKGQALIWSANILHGGALQRDKSRTRRSQVTHYYFEGCKYWTPLVSSADDVAWRDPEWIT
jgi:ectoine hydroxylase-related dioxygenase (phytanoyl-CoA dioxygenase family)